MHLETNARRKPLPFLQCAGVQEHICHGINRHDDLVPDSDLNIAGFGSPIHLGPFLPLKEKIKNIMTVKKASKLGIMTYIKVA